jgi:hypothetical protein
MGGAASVILPIQKADSLRGNLLPVIAVEPDLIPPVDQRGRG